MKKTSILESGLVGLLMLGVIYCLNFSYKENVIIDDLTQELATDIPKTTTEITEFKKEHHVEELEYLGNKTYSLKLDYSEYNTFIQFWTYSDSHTVSL